MTQQPLCWVIGGSDASGGAGIQSDIKTCLQFDVHACSVVTAVTAQNSQAVTAIHYLPGDAIHAQFAALRDELPPASIKIGMLGQRAAIQVVKDYLASYSGHVVLDPVMVSSVGRRLAEGDLQDYIHALTTLFPYVSMLTPNIAEAEALLNCRIQTYQDMEIAAQALLAKGVKSVLMKGGHHPDALFSQDYWTNGAMSCWIANHRYAQRNYRGTGCSLASAIAACLTFNMKVQDALVVAAMYVHRGIRLATPMAHQASLLAHAGWPEDEIDLPYVSQQPLLQEPVPFPAADAIGLYPVVDSKHWLEQLLPLGVKTIQLRVKNKYGQALENEIQASVKLANQYQANLYINDYWELAIRYGAYGVHLGQEDIQQADIHTIRAAGLRLGISTHCYNEVARAHCLRPSYLACGPIYPTTSKIMPFAPQGTLQLQRWRRTLRYPLVAIGGIHFGNLHPVLSCGVNGIAMISAITQAPDPATVTTQLLNEIKQYAA